MLKRREILSNLHVTLSYQPKKSPQAQDQNLGKKFVKFAADVPSLS